MYLMIIKCIEVKEKQVKSVSIVIPASAAAACVIPVNSQQITSKNKDDILEGPRSEYRHHVPLPTG